MAGAAVLPISSLSSFRLYSITSSSLSPISHSLSLPSRNPRFTICHAKVDLILLYLDPFNFADLIPFFPCVLV
uniref:Putative ovule protein n=1 Tax=Solanum chacoense TaxID=4108 RepID=A0A0V0GGW3_SOLCH